VLNCSFRSLSIAPLNPSVDGLLAQPAGIFGERRR
jgi:hypothetical protein